MDGSRRSISSFSTHLFSIARSLSLTLTPPTRQDTKRSQPRQHHRALAPQPSQPLKPHHPPVPLQCMSVSVSVRTMCTTNDSASSRCSHRRSNGACTRARGLRKTPLLQERRVARVDAHRYGARDSRGVQTRMMLLLLLAVGRRRGRRRGRGCGGGVELRRECAVRRRRGRRERTRSFCRCRIQIHVRIRIAVLGDPVEINLRCCRRHSAY